MAGEGGVRQLKVRDQGERGQGVHEEALLQDDACG